MVHKINLAIFFVIFYFNLNALAGTQDVQNTGTTIKIGIGDTVVYKPIGYSLTLKEFKKYESTCAVSGFNCGSGYFPGVQIMPIFEITTDKRCENEEPLPSECEITHKIVETDNATFMKIKFIDIFDLCEADKNNDNRNSCIMLTIKNGPYKPPFHPKNCERIKDPVVARDRCYEAVADELQDPAICGLMKGPQGFQCTLLRAKAAKDPSICKTLQKGPMHHSEADHKSQIASCLDAVSRIK